VGDEHRDLPGPSRVVTGPGQVAFDPVTGARRRRTGISSVPTSVILPDTPPPPPPPQHASAVEEYEAESEEEEEDSLREDEGEVEQGESLFSAKRTGAGMEGLIRVLSFSEAVLRICDILVLIRIRIRGSMPLTNAIFVIDLLDANKKLNLKKVFLLFEGTFTSFLKDKSQK
jgi:hypothetical protein